jgi:signal transduction histidine kinase
MPSAAPATLLSLPRAEARAVAFGGPAWLIVAATVVATPLLLASIVDLGGLRGLWDNLHWVGTALAAFVATAWSVRGTTGRVRAVRGSAAIAFGFWLAANLGWAFLTITGTTAIPSFADAFVFAIIAPGAGVLVGSVRGRMTRAEELAAYLDAALVLILIATILIHVHGPRIVALPTIAGFLALAYPTAFIGLAEAGLVALLAAGYPLARRGPVFLLGGSAFIGWAYLDWIVPTTSGAPAGELPSLLFTIGTLVSAYGAVTWTDALATGEAYRRIARLATRILAPTITACLMLSLLVPAPAQIDPILRAGLFLAGVGFVIRQALLLRERTETLDRLTVLTAENARLLAELRAELDRRAADERRVIAASRAAAVGELAAGVAHEVNNPLTGILGFSELLLADTAADDPRRIDLETIRDEALRARRIVSALRDFAAPAPPRLAPTDLADLVHRTVDLVRYSIERRGAVFHEELAELPTVLVDAAAVQQALVNVLTNAGQAVGTEGRIDVRLRCDGDWAVIAIADDGVGMDATTIGLAAEPFFTGRPDEPGQPIPRGLGLSVSSGLVESHGGTFAIDSWPGRGTTVEIRLPLRVAGDVDATIADETDAPTHDTGDEA